MKLKIQPKQSTEEGERIRERIKRWKRVNRREIRWFYSENHRKGHELEGSDFERQQLTEGWERYRWVLKKKIL